MILRQEGLASRASVLGTDVSRRRLAAARRGRYTPWALRATPPPIALAFFRKLPDGFALDPEIRRLVEFRPLNLAQATWPSPASGIGLFDLIVCRNVLIYFSDAVIRAVVGRFVDALAPGGWLCFGASDPPLRDLPSCETFSTGAGLAHRRSDPADPRPVAARPLIATRDALVEAPAEIVEAATWPEPAPADYVPPEMPPTATPAEPVVDGESEALHPERHHARAIALESEGRLDEAVAAARRAVFLDPDFAAAHLLLGIFLARTGERRPARRSLARATRLLAAMPPDARPAGSDGEPARVLLGLARAHLGRQAEMAGEP
jgi:chemotaxis protein methyltransferase CheR